MNDLVTEAPTSAPTVRQTTDVVFQDGPSVLGERQLEIPITGKLRPGIKIPTPTYSRKAPALKAYDDGMAAGSSYADIEKAMKAACGETDTKSCLMPSNAPYFTVRRSDFPVPEVADRIMELYAEDRGDGLHLYQLPVVFPVDSWQAVLPHGLKTFTRSELKYWSEYDAGGVRYCMTRAELAQDAKSKRFKKPFGGRKSVLRPDNNGQCIPEDCNEFQTGKCKLSGKLIFYIPGIQGAGAVALPTTSFYGMDSMRHQLTLMMHGRGRIAGTFQGKPMFLLTKQQEEVSMLDTESGKPKRVTQWLPKLEVDIDMTKFLSAPDDDGDTAVTALEGPSTDIEDDDDSIIEAMPSEVEAVTAPPSIDDIKRFVGDALRKLAIQYALFNPYAQEKFGNDWAENEKTLSQVLDELDAVDDRAAYYTKVENRDPFK